MCDRERDRVVGHGAAATPRLDALYEGLKRNEAAGKQSNSSIQYTPFFIRTMLDLYVSEQTRESILSPSADHNPVLREQLDLLERAGIVTHVVKRDRDFPYSVRVVDEDALRTYVNALCNVSLPMKVWVMR